MKASKLLIVLLVIVLAIGAVYLIVNNQYEENRQEVIACLEQGEFKEARDAVGNSAFFRWKDETLATVAATAAVFERDTLGVASFESIAQYAAAGNESAKAALRQMEPIAYQRAVTAYADEAQRHSAYEMFTALGDYCDSQDYVFVYETWEEAKYARSGTIGEDDLLRLLGLMEIPTVPELLVAYNYTAMEYLCGVWSAGSKIGGFVLDADYVAYYDLPYLDVECDGCRIEDGVFSLVLEDAVVADLYWFTPVDETHMDVYCFADGNTYSLTKLLDY